MNGAYSTISQDALQDHYQWKNRSKLSGTMRLSCKAAMRTVVRDPSKLGKVFYNVDEARACLCCITSPPCSLNRRLEPYKTGPLSFYRGMMSVAMVRLQHTMGSRMGGQK
eukprot:2880179-Amphidinium_carterae.1